VDITLPPAARQVNDFALRIPRNPSSRAHTHGAGARNQLEGQTMVARHEPGRRLTGRQGAWSLRGR